MARQKNDQIPLGELLTKARLDKNMSRAKLAKETGLSENSLVRYEKAGLEKDGQYPPSPKLAILCFELGISPLSALLGCLDRTDFWVASLKTSEEWLMGHPQHLYLEDQYHAMKEDNQILVAALRYLTGQKPHPVSHPPEYLEWLRAKTVEVIERQDLYRERLIAARMLDQQMQRGFCFPGPPDNPSRRGVMGEPFVTDYAALKRNGPAQEEPGRSENSKNNTEAVDAASTRPKKGKD
jgi:transcriptional regulator with XRE-family HTH domain